MSDYQHPHETVNLPSEGKFYPEGHPLRDGTIDIKYPTAKEEDILTSTNLVQKGLVYNKLLESIILSKHEDGKKIRPEELLVGDVDAILIAVRILAYGKEYGVSFECQHCQATTNVTVNLSQLESRDHTLDKLNDDGTFEYVLNEDVTLTMRLMTRGDDKRVRDVLDSLEKHNLPRTEITTRLKTVIVAVNGDKSEKIKSDLVDNMPIPDSRRIREDYAKLVPGVDFDINYVCDICRAENGGRIMIGPNFFWPDF